MSLFFLIAAASVDNCLEIGVRKRWGREQTHLWVAVGRKRKNESCIVVGDKVLCIHDLKRHLTVVGGLQDKRS